jgi:hypothetical protein
MLKARDLNRLAAILSRLDSDFAGERAAAGLLAARTLRELGLSWAELLNPAMLAASPTAPHPQWRDLVALCRYHEDALSEWEAEFLASLMTFSRISTKQLSTLEGIADRLGVAG